MLSQFNTDNKVFFWKMSDFFLKLHKYVVHNIIKIRNVSQLKFVAGIK